MEQTECGTTAQGGLTWSDAPSAAIYAHPYVVALLPNHIEVRSVQQTSQQGLAQVLFFASVHPRLFTCTISILTLLTCTNPGSPGKRIPLLCTFESSVL